MNGKIIHVFSKLKGHYDIQYDSESCPEGCDDITEHRPKGDGDKWFYDVRKGSRIFRLFDVEVATRLEI